MYGKNEKWHRREEVPRLHGTLEELLQGTMPDRNVGGGGKKSLPVELANLLKGDSDKSLWKRGADRGGHTHLHKGWDLRFGRGEGAYSKSLERKSTPRCQARLPEILS